MESKDSSGKKSPVDDLSWKIPDPSQGSMRRHEVEEPRVAAAASDIGVRETELDDEMSQRSIVPFLVVFFLGLLLIAGGVGAYFILQRPELIQEREEDRQIAAVTARWIEGSTAQDRFLTEWPKAKIVTTTELGEFSDKYWAIQFAYIKNPYSKDHTNIEEKKVKLFKDFLQDDLLGIELPFENFYSGEVSINTDRYVLKLTHQEQVTGDGGYLILKSLLSFKMPTEAMKHRMTGSTAPVTVRILLSPYHMEPRYETRSVRPMELPAAARRFDAINSYVTLTEADVIMSADLVGIATLDQDGKISLAKMKGYILPQ